MVLRHPACTCVTGVCDLKLSGPGIATHSLDSAGPLPTRRGEGLVLVFCATSTVHMRWAQSVGMDISGLLDLTASPYGAGGSEVMLALRGISS